MLDNFTNTKYNEVVKSNKALDKLKSLVNDRRNLMKLIEMKNIAENRENNIGFLHHSEIAIINQNLLDFDADKKSFNDICKEVLEQYQSKKITNRQASIIFDILANANKQFKTERYRYNSATHEIYEYSQANEAYIFIKKGNQSELKNLIAENCKYI